MSEEQQEAVSDEQVAEGEGSEVAPSDPLSAMGESPVDGEEHEIVQKEGGEEDKAGSKEKEGAVGGAPKHGRFRTSKAEEGELYSVQHCG